MSRHSSLSCTIACQSSILITFRSSNPSIHLFLNCHCGLFPWDFHSKVTLKGSFFPLFCIWPSYWIFWPLRKLPVPSPTFLAIPYCIFLRQLHIFMLNTGSQIFFHTLFSDVLNPLSVTVFVVKASQPCVKMDL